MVTMTYEDLKKPLTKEELKELKLAAKRPIVYDEDCPEMTPEMLKQFKRMHPQKRTKESVSLRVSADTLEKAKAYGKGYTAFLSRLLDVAINNEEIVKKCI